MANAALLPISIPNHSHIPLSTYTHTQTHADEASHLYLRRYHHHHHHRHRHLNETATLPPLAPAPFFFSDSFDTYPLGPFPTPLTDDSWLTTTISKDATVMVANFDKQNEGDKEIA